MEIVRKLCKIWTFEPLFFRSFWRENETANFVPDLTFGTEGWGFESLRVYFPAFLRPSVLGNAGFLLDVRCCSTLRCGLLLPTTKIKRLSQLDCISFTPLHTPALAFTRVVEQLATLGRDGSDSKSRYWSKAKWER